jgi:pyruvate kinase
MCAAKQAHFLLPTYRVFMIRATKIVATIGPASSEPEVLLQMINAGCDVVRLNFSHGTAQDHRQRAEFVREAARRAGREVAMARPRCSPATRSSSIPIVNWATTGAWASTTKTFRAISKPATSCCSTTV